MFFGREKENTKIQASVEVNEVKKLTFEMIFAKLMTHVFKTLQAILSRIRGKKS